jgi:hypothetical protein
MRAELKKIKKAALGGEGGEDEDEDEDEGEDEDDEEGLPDAMLERMMYGAMDGDGNDDDDEESEQPEEGPLVFGYDLNAAIYEGGRKLTPGEKVGGRQPRVEQQGFRV